MSPLSRVSGFEPSYMIKYNQDHYEVQVSFPNNYLLKADQIQDNLIQEAKKNSLLGMAYVQQLAKDGDPRAVHIRSLYQGYHQYFDNQDKKQFKKICEEIIQDHTADPLVNNMAKYILALLENKPIDSSWIQAKDLINDLIPYIEQTLLMPQPKKIANETEVKIPEMDKQHNAFPDLIKYQGYYFACFREADRHVGFKDLGRIRILRGQYDEIERTWSWENAGLLENKRYDLRDPKFFINHENKLQIIMDGSIINEKDETDLLVPFIATSGSGGWQLFEANVDQTANGPKGLWIWRVTWNPIDNCGYALSYGKDSVLSLLKTEDGITFHKISEFSCDKLKESLTEATIKFKTDGTLLALIRSQKHGIIAKSDLTSTAIPVKRIFYLFLPTFHRSKILRANRNISNIIRL